MLGIFDKNFNEAQRRDSECPSRWCISCAMLLYRVVAAASSFARMQGSERFPDFASLGRVDFSNYMKLQKPTSGDVRQRANTATERWRRHGAFCGTEVLEDVIPASAEVNSETLHGEPITAA
jgi:hypothetical protein